MTIEEAVQQIRQSYPEAVLADESFRGETSLTISASELRILCAFARDRLGFDYLLDVASVDNFGDEPRFEMVYELYSMGAGVHLRLKCAISEDSGEIDTVSDIWPTANWHEREVYDMMGIRFKGHPDLRRILMWDGYPHFPLRKDFPLEGKATDVPEVAFTGVAPLAGGPFVTAPTDGTTQVREPRARRAGVPAPREKFIADP
jgi:NADH-quinone oxidoreductase subunit C